MEIIEFISEYRVLILIGVVIVIIMFRKRIGKFFKRKKDTMPEPPPFPFDEEFNFNKTSEDEKKMYERKLSEMDKELNSITKEQKKITDEFNSERTRLLHKERQLKLKYNMYLNNLKNVDQMIANQKQMEEELGK